MDLSLVEARLRRQFSLQWEDASRHHQSAAVLIALFSQFGEAKMLMIKRAMTLKIHRGEIAFPGGMIEDDESFLETALRETDEEIGVDIPREKVIACLKPVLTLTGFEVTPFIAILDSPPDCLESFNEDEVEEVLFLPFLKVLSTQQRDIGHPQEDEMFVYWHLHHRIWGASAKMIFQIAEAIFK
jgi:8-oxo-dGTP pyrophosphatase MutT (NUDIX family)